MSERAKVVRLVPVLDFGGVESIVDLQAKLLEGSRYELRVCTFWKDGQVAASLRGRGVPVDVLGVDPSIRNPGATLALAEYLLEQRPQIVHSSIGEANFHAALVGKLAGGGAVILEESGLPDRHLLARMVHAALYRLVDQVVGVSDASCRYVVTREGAPAGKVRRLYNAISPEFFAPRLARAPGERVEIVAVGRLVPVKNYELLLDAISSVIQFYPKLRLRIVGDGPLKTSLSDKIERAGLHEHVELLGFRQDVMSILDSSDIFVLPSISEGMGIALVEAMARGLPVLSTTAGGAAELVAPLGPDWSISPTDREGWSQAIMRLVALAPPEREALGRQALRRAADFAPAAHLDQLTALYDEMLHAPRWLAFGGAVR